MHRHRAWTESATSHQYRRNLSKDLSCLLIWVKTINIKHELGAVGLTLLSDDINPNVLSEPAPAQMEALETIREPRDVQSTAHTQFLALIPAQGFASSTFMSQLKMMAWTLCLF